MKTIFTMVLAVLISTIAYAGKTETSVQAAQKNLIEDITLALNKDVNDPNNYFAENEIRNVKENVKVTFYVNGEQEVVLLRVKTDSYDAENYVKHFLKNNIIHADSILSGQAYTFNLYLRYKMH